MSNGNNEILELKQFFKSQNIKLSDVWLESCLNWCKNEVLTNNYTKKQLQSQVYEQWLLLDLRDVELEILPKNLSLETHFILTDIYCLQLMEIIDISKPKLWQLQNIRNKNNPLKKHDDHNNSENTNNINNKRMLQLLLTDGVQEIQAIEYRTIPILNVNLMPGVKIRLIGPITVRRGRLLLESHNIKILNGHVEELLITNAAENVLAKYLNLPLNSNPQQIEQIAVIADEERRIETNRNVQNSVSQQQLITDEERMITEGVDVLLEAEREHLNEISNRNPVVSLTATSGLDDDFFDDIDIDAHLNQVDNIFNNEDDDDNKQQKQETKTNLITIEKLLENKNFISRGRFKIKAKFNGIVEKVTMTEHEYRLVIKIVDNEQNTINVKVHSDIITDFAGHYPSALISLKSNVLQKDPVATEKVLKVLQKIKDKIVAIDNILEIQVDRNEELCTIVKIL